MVRDKLGDANAIQSNEVERLLPPKHSGNSWFKDSATEHLARMHQIKRVLEQYGHPVVMLSEPRIGYVTYEDAFQVIAEPFSDT